MIDYMILAVFVFVFLWLLRFFVAGSSTRQRISAENCKICRGTGYIIGRGDTPIIECPNCTAGFDAATAVRSAVLSGTVYKIKH